MCPAPPKVSGSVVVRLNKPLSGCSMHRAVATYLVVNQLEEDGEVADEFIFMCDMCYRVYQRGRTLCPEDKRLILL